MAALSVRETSHGTSFELPVLHEGDFDTGVFLTGIPRDPRYRVMLRIYSIDDPAPTPHTVQVYVSGVETDIPRAFTEVTLSRAEDAEPWFAQVTDVNALKFDDFGRPSTDTMLAAYITSPGQRIWAFASIVDNETQQARIVTPMRWKHPF